ncbi:MAG: DMT family transporter [Ruminococcus sp.]|nr:DMT family transporter [Ruminococcus sp.]
MLTGIICVAGAASLLGILPTIQKQLMVDGLPLNGLMFYTNLTITIVCLLAALIKKHSLKATKMQAIQALLMGVFGMIFTAVLLNSSYLYLPVGTTIMLNFLYPTIVCIIMGIIFKGGFTKLQIAAIAASILGMVFLTGAGGNLSVIGMVLAIASAFTYGIYLVANEKGPANDLPIEVKLFYVSLPATIVFAVIAPATGTLVVPPGGALGWVLAIGGSGMFTVGGYFLMMYGISRLGASTAAFVSMLEPIVSVVFGTIWFKDPVTVGIVVGGVLIITSILLITIDGYKKSKEDQKE